jgi:hypothetical protein
MVLSVVGTGVAVAGSASAEPITASDGESIQDRARSVGAANVQAEPFDFGVELEQEETVAQGDDANISAYPNNRADEPVSNATLELVVDADADGQFESDEVVASRSVDFDAGEYRTVELTYENVQLDPGTYQYRAQISKSGQTTTSYTNGTLTVEGGSSEPFDFGVELEQEETVAQGDDANISAYPNNRADEPVSNATLELVVDADADGQFESDEVVASRSVDFDAGEYRTVELTYENVQLDPGTYQYRAQISKNGETTPSFTNGTLTVENGSGTQRTLEDYTDENGNAGPGDVFDAIDDWRADEIGPTLVFEVVSRWRSS